MLESNSKKSYDREQKLMRGAIMRRIPSLNALKSFEATARHSSFTLAAEELLVTQSAVSRQIRHLEEHLETKLFLRRPKNLELTPRGRVLVSCLTEMFDRLEAVTAEVQSKTNELRIKLPPTFAIRWLVPRMQEFQTNNEDIEVLLCTGWDPVNFSKEEFHVGIVCDSDLALFDDTVDSELFVDEYVTPVCSPDLLERGPPIFEVSDLFEHVLLHGTNLFDAWEHWFAAIGEPYDNAAKTQVYDLMDTAVHAAVRGIGVALATPQFVLEDLEIGRLVMPFPELAPRLSGYYLVSPKKCASLECLQRFRSWMLESTPAEWNQDIKVGNTDVRIGSDLGSRRAPKTTIEVLESGA